MKRTVPIHHWGGLVLFLAVLIWSGIEPADRFTWFLEVLPALIGLVFVVVSYQRFPLTELLLCLLLIHAIVLMVGGHYTYANVPLFDWIKDSFGLSRNHYDKVGHFFQGLVPAILAREILIRKHVINGTYWQHFVVLCIVLAFSAFYELIEWWVACFSGESAEAFLGTQGDVWDTQSDMLFALLGGFLGLALFHSWHDNQLKTNQPC